MDQETLCNHLTNLSKSSFEVACRIVLRSVFNLNAINVDGSGDGGTDFSSFKSDGTRSFVAYQITTQKKDIERKAYTDAEKVIEKLSADRFYFLTTLPLSETHARRIENDICTRLGITAICFGAKHIAGFLIEDLTLLNQFLDESSYPLPRSYAQSPDYREMALHAYTLMSKDASNMRESIYDDTIIFVISEREEITEDETVNAVISFLRLDQNRASQIKKRIGALFSRQLIERLQNGKMALSQSANYNLVSRKRVYERELNDLAAAQVDLMRRDFDSNWTLDDSRSVSVFIADIYIAKQIELLKDIRASIVVSSFFNVEERGVDSLKKYLVKHGKVKSEHLDQAVEKLIKTASNHPLINKLARASVYVALEGANPIVSAKALGAARWSDYRILVEPSVAIPWICSQLYKGRVNRFFDSSFRSIKRALDFDTTLHITYFYINECAGHLLRARKYAGINLDPKELRFSPNAFISNYFSLKDEGVKVPEDLLEYLKTFSPSVLVERFEIRDWVRAIMTDIQTILTRSGIQFVESPKYNHNQCAVFETEYVYCLSNNKIDKSRHLIDHDVWALQFTNDLIAQRDQRWLILTYDRSLLDVGRSNKYAGWVTTPEKFLDLTETYRPLAETQYISLVHSFASYSEKTLSAGARIIDRIVQYASPEMQNWEFRRDLEEFKKGIFDAIDLNTPNVFDQIDSKTDKFLKDHGIELHERKLYEDEEVD